jgi:hypothetical protein
MIKSINELQKEGWKKICTDIWMIEHKSDHYLFYSEKFNMIHEHIWTKRFEKDLTSYIKMSLRNNMTKAKFFKTYGEEEGKKMILINLAKLYLKEPQIYYSTVNGKKLYCRTMITIDQDYHNGMQVVAEVETEKIIGRHFDNVISNLSNKGLISSQKNVKLQREEKLMRITNEKPKNEDVVIQNQIENFPLEEIVDKLEQERFDIISGKNIKYKWTVEQINKAKSEVLAQQSTCTIADIMSKLK